MDHMSITTWPGSQLRLSGQYEYEKYFHAIEGAPSMLSSHTDIAPPQIAEVRLVNGRFESRLPPPAGGSGAPPAWDMAQQMVQLSILMLYDMGTLTGHLYKVGGG